MKIGIIGLGVVGSANKYGFEKVGHEVLVHDIKRVSLYLFEQTTPFHL